MMRIIPPRSFCCWFVSSTRTRVGHVAADVGRRGTTLHSKSIHQFSTSRAVHIDSVPHDKIAIISTQGPSPPPCSSSSVHASSTLPPLHRPLLVHNILGIVPYSTAWDWQKRIVREKIQFERTLKSLNKQQSAGVSNSESESIPGSLCLLPGYADRLLIVEHQPVYTLGRNSSLEHLRFPPHIRVQIDESRSPTAGATDSPSSSSTNQEIDYHIVRVERGGEVTYHGPGQIVLYPLLALQPQPMLPSSTTPALSLAQSSNDPPKQISHHPPSPYRPDLHWFLRSLENVVIRFLALFDVQGERIEGASGVWVDFNKLYPPSTAATGRQMKKLSAVGLSCSSWVSMHGIAINISNDLSAFDWIVPCGLSDTSKYAGVTSLEEVLSVKKKYWERGGATRNSSDVDVSVLQDGNRIREQILKCFIDEFQLQHVDLTASAPIVQSPQPEVSNSSHIQATPETKDITSVIPLITDKATVQEQHLETAA